MVKLIRMNASQLTPGIYVVRIRDPHGQENFNLSVVDGCGVMAVAAFMPGQKIPRRGKHLLLTDSVRNWIGQMELVTEGNHEHQRPRNRATLD